MKTRLRALVLAAGGGHRLRPLTTFLPKPLLPVAGRPVAAYSLERLQAFGCEAAALNLHHLAREVEEHFGASFQGMPLVYSREEELLGTLGALRPLRTFLEQADCVLLINGDSLCRWPLRQLVRQHLKKGARATLLLSERADPEEYGGGVEVDEEGWIVDLRSGAGSTGPQAAGSFGSASARDERQGPRRRVFAGAHILSPDLLRSLEGEGPADVVADLYLPLLRRGERLLGVSTRHPWYDLGTPRRYLDGVLGWVQSGLRGRFRQRWISRSARLASGARVRRSVIESDSRVERGARIESSLVLDGAVVGRESRLLRCIVAPGVRLPPKTWVERRLITPLKAGRDPGASDSVVGDLVYTPVP